MVLENIVPFLQHETARNHALTPKQQLQIALHWLGTGAQFHAIADMHGVSKSSVCRAIQNVVHGINNNLFHVLVQWPNNVYEIIQKFSDRSGMPLVCGAIDGTLIKIDAPSAHEPAFVDRNGKHSLNVMLVCGPDCTFYFCNANWPGSVNDARVLRRSSLYTRMEQGWRPAPDAVLIGDSIYPLRSWLIPPLLRNPEDPAQLRFVRAHKKQGGSLKVQLES
ncbi:putative nuclease HARBI1 [Blattella germanica]|nr:putative nuclease HARBI1 [Blattella germanica]